MVSTRADVINYQVEGSRGAYVRMISEHECRLERGNLKRKLFEDLTNMEQSAKTRQECVEQISITYEKVRFMDSFVKTECEMEDAAIQTTASPAFSIHNFDDDAPAVLAGSTPGDAISDRQIVERSSLTKLCSKNDRILADKDFNLQDIFAPHDVHINIPTFLKKQNRMNRMSNETVIID
ncbi:hypothetical protein DPMN_049481 [Dreissena polymorpha]|uniref:DDE Tnp4 domain-containing protein n=1 Tax=Dreissena polymorpha TaxID=45954 RepID=A0A9D4HKH7_DREPO|nr:hypothetical protein DPMN_049481 [Dreissena polymorpha]